MGSSTSTILVYFGLLAVAFYFLIIRPQQQRQRQQRELMSALKIGDRVMTASGIFGTVQRLEPDVVTLRVAEGVDIEMARGAISQRVEPGSAESVQGPSDE